MVINVLPSTDAPSLLPPPQIQTTVEPAKEKESQAGRAEDSTPAYWRWLSYLLATGWAISALIWWLQVRTMRLGFDGAIVAPKKNEKGASRRALEKQLKKACQDTDARAVEDALLDWAEVVWDVNPPSNLTEMAAKVDDQFAEQLEGLNRAIYSSDGGEWRSEIWKMARSFRLKKAVMERESIEEPLGKLYPR